MILQTTSACFWKIHDHTSLWVQVNKTFQPAFEIRITKIYMQHRWANEKLHSERWSHNWDRWQTDWYLQSTVENWIDDITGFWPWLNDRHLILIQIIIGKHSLNVSLPGGNLIFRNEIPWFRRPRILRSHLHIPNSTKFQVSLQYPKFFSAYQLV